MSQENTLLTLHIISSSVADIAFSLTWGVVLLLYWNAMPRALSSRLYKCFSAAALILCLALSALLLLLCADMGGTTHWSEIRPLLPDVISMHAGSVLRSQLTAALLMGICGLLPLSQKIRRPLVTALLLALTVFKSASGHAATDGSFSLREISQCLHLFSIASWAGGILLAAWLVLAYLERDHATLYSFARRLSIQCTISVALVFLSGLCNSWLITEGSWAPLRSSTWGALLIVKIVFVLLALGIGFLNRRDLSGELTTSTLRRFVRRIRLEAAIMLVILCLSGWLSNLSPS